MKHPFQVITVASSPSNNFHSLKYQSHVYFVGLYINTKNLPNAKYIKIVPSRQTHRRGGVWMVWSCKSHGSSSEGHATNAATAAWAIEKRTRSKTGLSRLTERLTDLILIWNKTNQQNAQNTYRIHTLQKFLVCWMRSKVFWVFSRHWKQKYDHDPDVNCWSIGVTR